MRENERMPQRSERVHCYKAVVFRSIVKFALGGKKFTCTHSKTRPAFGTMDWVKNTSHWHDLGGSCNPQRFDYYPHKRQISTPASQRIQLMLLFTQYIVSRRAYKALRGRTANCIWNKLARIFFPHNQTRSESMLLGWWLCASAR